MTRWLITMTCEVEAEDEEDAWEKFHDLLDSPAEFDYSADIAQLLEES
jgi:thioester reductase-like protein